MNLETPRTTVRPFVPEDLDGLQEILGDAETMRFSQPPSTRAQTENFMREFCIRRQGGLAVVRRADGKLIGYLLLHETAPAVYEIGWFFNRAVWRQGYALESCRTVIDAAFDRLGARKIFAETADPARSVPLMRRLGMRREGVQRMQVVLPDGRPADLHLYGLLREEWAEQQAGPMLAVQ
ncbi:GNAT family N-acetyltransferase [uncultured Gemmiger sp.]|uniref:GNAT family N-acetyltransferase n=1 Tax=uncultured Gemmiger sp. TaxID=1623490 RepID=UPI0025CDBC22|nr:GNAT family N-acetyltransferase [uncultured Gemmiger sp.]